MARSTYARAEWYDAMKFDPRINNTISEKDEKLHNQLRYQLSHAVCQFQLSEYLMLTKIRYNSILAKTYLTGRDLLMIASWIS